MRFDAIKQYGRTSKCKCKIAKPRAFESLVGRKFGYLEVVEFAGKAKNHDSLWRCRCTKCNENYTITSRTNLMNKIKPVTMCRPCADKEAALKKTIDLKGKDIGYITVIDRDYTYNPNRNYRATYWKCRCNLCGKIFTVDGGRLRGDDHIISCEDCYHKFRATIHGMHNTPFYAIWGNMKQRCYNPNNPVYIHYGARSIKVCDRWRYSFINFYNDMYQSYCEHKSTHEYTTIDRINPDGDYCPENCRWATYSEQQNNKRNNVRYSVNGSPEYTIRELIDNRYADSDRTYENIHTSLVRNHSIEEALKSPKRKECVNPIFFTDDKSYFDELCKQLNIKL